jgi:(R)-2-hydroxyacyl-CoA dehydratese activating ATPase
MSYAGIDLGSRTVALVAIDRQGAVTVEKITDTGFDPLAAAQSLLEGTDFAQVLATGYGRTLFEVAYSAPTVTEIKAHGRGAAALFPGIRAVLDIGGQDSKAIALNEQGKVVKFEMNDRCAAGTGKFLEVMAKSLGFAIEDFGSHALAATEEFAISSMCTVFAESEVTSLIARGGDRRSIAKGLQRSVVRRAVAMLNRVAPTGDVVFSGGVANNPCVCTLMAEELGRRLLLPAKPQFVGAYGAALLAREKAIAGEAQ